MAPPEACEEPQGAQETRKVQVIGGSTYAVTLPKRWVGAVGVRPRDEVTLHLRADGSVLMVPRRERRPEPQGREVELATSEPDEVTRMLVGLYVSGVTTVVLRARGSLAPGLRRTVEDACQRLRGLQVVDEGPSSVTLQDLADPRDLDMRKEFRRMQLHAYRMLQGAGAALEAPGGGIPLSDVERSEEELDRIWLLMLKQHHVLLRDLSFEKGGGVSATESLSYLLAAQNLERVGDYAHRIAVGAEQVRASHCGRVAAPRLRGALQEAAGLVDDAANAFVRRDLALANRTIRQVQGFLDGKSKALLAELAATCGADPALRAPVFLGCFAALESVDRVARYAKSLAEVAINLAMAAEPPGAAAPGAARPASNGTRSSGAR